MSVNFYFAASDYVTSNLGITIEPDVTGCELRICCNGQPFYATGDANDSDRWQPVAVIKNGSDTLLACEDCVDWITDAITD